MKNLFPKTALVIIGLLLLAGCQKSEKLSAPAIHKKAKAAMQYEATLSTLNSSGASGSATLMLDGDTLWVTINASGLEPNRPHAQHIHGSPTNKGNATCPPPSADTDGDGLVSVGEGFPFYGPVLLPLIPFPIADAAGNISYSESFVLGSGGLPTAKDLGPLQNRVVVLHGMNDNSNTYIPSLPAACGQLTKAGNSPRPGSSK